MVLPMSRPQKNARSNVYYFRQRVPADLVDIFVRNEVSRSLGTKDPEIARIISARIAPPAPDRRNRMCRN